MSLKTLKPVFIALILSAVCSVLANMFIPGIYSGTWYVSLIFHVLISVLIQLLLFKKSEDQKEYINKIMFSSMGRLLVCMFGLLIYKLIDKANFTQFAVHFMIHYILFTIFEIAYLLKFIKTRKP
jgi:hypothetical protein